MYIFFSALAECAWAIGHVPSPSYSFSQGTTSYFPVQHKRSSYSMKLKERKNETNCHLLARDNRSYFFICSTMDLPWWGYAMYFQDIQTPCSQFKRKNKFGLTRIFPPNTECKNCHQQGSKNYTTFCPHAFRARSDSMCHVYPVEDCVKGLKGNFLKLPYT